MNTQQAKQIKIADYLHTLGINPKRIKGAEYWYCSPLRSEQTASFKVDNRLNTWYDHGLGKGGNIIDLVMSLHKLSTVSEALSHLDKQHPSFSFFNSNTSFEKENNDPKQSEIIIQKVLPITNKALIDYLTERKINIDIAKEHCQEVYYSVNHKQYFALGFKNDSGGYELRNKYFKGCTSKDISTSNNENEACLVFEGFMDYLSYLTMKNTARSQVDIVILNSIANLSKALNFIGSHPKVYTYLDNDEAGRKATQIINNTCKSHIDKSTEYTKYKDLNEYLYNKKLAEKEELKRKPLRGFRH